MAFREQLRRRRKDNRWIIGILTALLLVFVGVSYLLQHSRNLPEDLIRNRILLFALLYVDVVLILAILFVLLRNIFKLLIERQHRILGSKFKFKLVATYIGLSLVPVLLLFVYGSLLLRGWVERWLSEPAIRQVLEQGYAVAEALNSRIEQTHALNAARVRREVEEIGLGNPRRRAALTRRLEALLNELGLDYLAVYEETDFVHAVIRPQSGIRDLPDTRGRFLLEALDRGNAVRFLTPPGIEGRLILTAVTGGSPSTGRRTVVVVGTLLDPIVTAQTEQLIEAYQGYRQLEAQKSDIETSYRLIFLMVTLLILLAFSWVGLYLARRVTVPIQALAEGTRRISSGDLDHRVNVEADDELGVLVDSFNNMTAELQRNKEQLVATNLRLGEERALIAAVLERVAAGVVSVDRERRVLTCNAAALNMLKQRGSEMIGKPIHKVWTDPERKKLIRLFEERPSGWSLSSRQLRLLLGGEWKTFEAKVKAMRDAEGRLTGQVLVLEDLSELIKAQQLAAWNEAARRIAHEIKNPLTPIKLSAERLRKRSRQGEAELGGAVEEAVEIIVREVKAMKEMVDEFSRFARMPSPHPAPVDLARLVEDAVRLYEGIKPGVEVEGTVDPEVREALLDGEQVKRALINLLDNAIEATDAPGQVEVSVHQRNGAVTIHVRDTGRGIPAEAREKLFLPHFSTKGRGTGLGLAIVHRIVTDHQGTIRVEDNSPRGTVFTIELPL